MREEEVYEICREVDSFIAEYLKESIISGASYDLMEARMGILPVSRNSFYRKKRRVLQIIKKRMEQDKENSNEKREV